MFLSFKLKNLIKFAIALFLIAASYGMLIRWNLTFPIKNFQYQHFLQAHSHVAFLGWGYLSVIVAVLILFLSKEQRNHKIYTLSIAIISLTVFLMLISFPLTGYKVFSIVLLAVFGLTSYVLSFKLLKDLKTKNCNNTETKLLQFGIYYYLLSSIATWFVAIISASQGKTVLYYNAVYFYLHFLYNGFFVFVLFALFFKLLQIQKVVISEKYKKMFFVFLNIACIPAYVLSVLWSTNNAALFIIGFLASLLQIISFLFLFKILKSVFLQIKWNFIFVFMLKFVFVAYALKILLQTAGSFPYFVSKSLALKPFFIIGYLHLFTLAFMSVFLILILSKLSEIKKIFHFSYIGIYLFLTGVLFTELGLFFQGLSLLFLQQGIVYFNFFMLIFSIILVLGIFLLFLKQFVKIKT